MFDEVTGASDAQEHLFGGAVPLEKALAKLRLRLLDLTARNRLLNFKPGPGKSLTLIDVSPEHLYRKLVEGNGGLVVAPVPEPKRSDWVVQDRRLIEPDVKEHAESLGINPSLELVAAGTSTNPMPRALYFPAALERHLRKLAREAKSAIEETGANTLYLVIGLLEYPDKEGSEKLLNAPLISIPVALAKADLERSTGHYRYSLRYTEEDIEDNLSLREKLRRDWSLELPALGELDSVEAYLKEVVELVKEKPQWRVKRQMMLALLSFSKMLLVRDLDASNWPKDEDGKSLLTEHAVVRTIFEGLRDPESVLNKVEEYPVDEHPLGDIPLIYDCDSSQHSALIDAHSGRHLVIEGPPGTGKSQTITNLIASAIAEGKTVLFVSEKLAALQVVKNRLENAGLGDFCLELHSNKTNKKQLLEEIAARQARVYKEPPGFQQQLHALAEKKETLKTYVELLNSVVGNAQGLTMQQVMWRTERYRQHLGEHWKNLQGVAIDRAHELTDAEFRSLSSTLRQLAAQFDATGSVGPDHPFWGFHPTELGSEGGRTIQIILRDYLPKFECMATVTRQLTDFLGEVGVAVTLEQAHVIQAGLSSLETAKQGNIAYDCLPRLFPDGSQTQNDTLIVLKEFNEHLVRANSLELAKSAGLQEGVHITSAEAQHVEQLQGMLHGLGLADVPLVELASLANKLSSQASAGEKALAEMNRLGQEACIPFDGTSAAMAQIAAVFEVSASAPYPLLHFRHRGLKRPDAGVIAERAKSELLALQTRKSELEKSLHMDELPPADHVLEAIQVFREGQAWWRFVQSEYRGAKKLHRRLSRNPKSGKRLQELEALHAYQKNVSRWSMEPVYKEVFGSLHTGVDMRMADATTLVRWCATARARLVEVGVAPGVFDFIAVEESTLIRLGAASNTLRVALATMHQAEEHLLFLARKAPRLDARLAAMPLLPERMKTLSSIAADVQGACANLKRWGKSTASANQVLSSIAAYDALRGVLTAINGATEAKVLLGDRFKGRATDMAPVRDALQFGREVLKKNFPTAVTKTLLTKATPEDFGRLAQLLRKLEEGWADIDAFVGKMGAYGKFDAEQWAGVKLDSADFVPKFCARTESATQETEKLLPWVQYVQAAERANDRGHRTFVSKLEEGAIPPQQLAAAYGYRFYASITERLFKGEYAAKLGWFSGATHENVRNEFAELDRDITKARGKQCAAKAAANARPLSGQTGMRVDDRTEMQLLNLLIPQTRPRMPIRKLLRKAGRSIQAYKPCFLMGPQAVAQFLQPGALKFDLVIMDEASQLRPEEAIGAAARGTQLVVVGDPKQLPPSAFWEKLGQTDDDESQQAALLEMESILDVCIGHFHPVRRLRWHYRSQHESLIAFSNARFYNGDLIVFPSPYKRSRALGVRYEYIQGAVYDNQKNTIEARRVVDAVVQHMLEHPNVSLGVVTLNLAQRDLIEDLLEEKLKALPRADAFRTAWADKGMSFFVKNLENVQGDERDVIFVSTTFGKPPNAGAVRQTFGPIARADGWRRLNVLFTRARKALHVYSSMRPEDIVSDNTTPRGTRELRAYLEYARSGIIEDNTPTGQAPDSDFETAVARVLEQAGYTCVPQLGVAGYRIDIAVRHPAHAHAYLAAIECDGATYHSGKSVRDRDRIRQEVIESLGWKGRIWRIWSTDWFRNAPREAAKLIAWLRELEHGSYPDALLVAEEGATSEAAVEVAERTPAEPVYEFAEDSEMEVSVGDTVIYSAIGDGGGDFTVHISSQRSNHADGIVWEGAPLAQTLLGATAGEEVVLRVPGQLAKKFLVKNIVRPRPEDALR